MRLSWGDGICGFLSQINVPGETKSGKVVNNWFFGIWKLFRFVYGEMVRTARLVKSLATFQQIRLGLTVAIRRPYAQPPTYNECLSLHNRKLLQFLNGAINYWMLQL